MSESKQVDSPVPPPVIETTIGWFGVTERPVVPLSPAPPDCDDDKDCRVSVGFKGTSLGEVLNNLIFASLIAWLAYLFLR